MRRSNVTDRDRPDRDLSTQEVETILSRAPHNSYTNFRIGHDWVTYSRTMYISSVCDLSQHEGEYWFKVQGKGRKKREVLIHPPIFELICRFRNRRDQMTVLDAADQSPYYLII